MDDRYTNFYAEYILIDTTAVEDSTPSTTSNADFADISLLKEDTPYPDYMTLEHNYSVLDGSLQEFPDAPSGITYWSSPRSNSDGLFDEECGFTVDFEENHSSVALTLFFIGEHPLQMKCRWVSSVGQTLYEGTYDINRNEYIVHTDVERYHHLEITFLKAIPDRHVKLYYLKYGLTLSWDETNVKSASIVQEIDRLSDKISIDQLTISAIDLTGDELNLANPKGLHRYFQADQRINAWEQVNEDMVFLGNFYLKEFSEDSNLGNLVFESIVGRLDKFQFETGKVYDGVEAGTIIDEIMAAAGITDYTVDDETRKQLMYGAIKPMTCRKALREVIFACNSVVSSIGTGLRIYKTTDAIDGFITRGKKITTKATKLEYVYGVEVKYTDYDLAENTSQIAKGTYPPGKTKITFSTPCKNLVIDKGEILEQSDFYCIFTLDAESSIIITGNKYQTTNTTVTVTQAEAEPGEARLIKSYTTSLCNSATAIELAGKILKYHNYRLQFDIKQLAEDSVMENWKFIDNPSPAMQNYIGIYQKRNIDLAGGFIDDCTLVGYINDADYMYYATDGEGAELYANNDIII